MRDGRRQVNGCGAGGSENAIEKESETATVSWLSFWMTSRNGEKVWNFDKGVGKKKKKKSYQKAGEVNFASIDPHEILEQWLDRYPTKSLNRVHNKMQCTTDATAGPMYNARALLS